MVDISKETQAIKLLKLGRQRDVLNYLYDNMSGTELTELAQIGTRLNALAESVSSRKSRENQARKRSMGSGTEGSGFIPV